MDIQLEPFESEDIPRLMSWIPSAEFLMQWSGPYFTYPLTREQIVCYLNSVEKSPLNRAIYRVREMDKGQIIGHIELNNIDWRNLAASVSKVLIGVPEMRGLGIGHKMMAALLDYAFGDLHLHRLELKVFDDNTSAITCYQQNGFFIEGHLRDYRLFRNSYKSSYLMSILESDWRNIRQGKIQEK
jgi:RimJ/RimL family protein N-acetyltransferase